MDQSDGKLHFMDWDREQMRKAGQFVKNAEQRESAEGAFCKCERAELLQKSPLSSINRLQFPGKQDKI